MQNVQLKRTHRARIARHWITYGLKVLLGILIIFPVLICIMYALKGETEILQSTSLLPKHPTLSNFKWVIHMIPIGTYLINTLIQCAAVIICQIIFCSLAAYALVFFEFKGKAFLFTLILATMMIPGDVVVITNYIQIQHWHMTNTHLGMALPYLISGMGIFLMRQFYLTLPHDLKDAADIDGCGDMGFFFRIALPLSVPSLASLAIYQFILIYNRYFWPLLVTNTDSMRTVQIGMAMLEGGENGRTGNILAGATLCILPVAVVFIIGQKYLIKGMTAGAVKG